MRWLLPETAQDGLDGAARLGTSLGVHPLAARVLFNRGLRTVDAVSAFLTDGLSALPEPLRMKGMAAAVERLSRALRAGEKITLWGDYDVDGVCSTTLLRLFLEECGATVATYIPHRLGEGYGLNVQAIEKIAQDGTRVLVTLDCGITSHAEVGRANALGLEVIVADHHAVPDTMPPAMAVLNPLQPGCDYPTPHLCAAGVAFNLVMALRRRLREEGWFATRREPNLKGYLDLVALATVADVVPLTGANRILVKHGLVELTAARRPGIRALKAVAGMNAGEPVTAGQVGFRLGPRINAAGRLADASLGMQLLCARTLDEAGPLARALDQANRERQDIEQEILNQALAQAGARKDVRGLVLHADGWHPGVIGIVASRVVERFHRPTVMVGFVDGVGRGSARSIEGFNLVSALGECASHLVKYGGHKAAAGLTVDPAAVGAFREAFERVAATRLCDEDLIPRLRVDAVVRPSDLDPEAVGAVEALGPFGMGHPQPVFALRHTVVHPKVLASKREGGAAHLKLRLEGAPHLDAIGFSMGEKLPLTEGPVDLAFNVGFDEWNGVRRLSLKLKQLRTAA